MERLLVCAVVVALAATGAYGRGRRSEREAQPLPADTVGAVPDSAPPVAPPQSGVVATFLDTLNRGRETRLAEADLQPPAAAATEPSATPAPAGRPASRASAGAPPMRIQCMASTQADAAQEARAVLAAKVSYPVIVLFNPPYYKLLVGEFSDRTEAERALYDVKGLGYPDAWIVKGLTVEE